MPRKAKVLKTDFVFARVTPEERDILQRAADAQFLSMSAWVRQTLLTTATAPTESLNSSNQADTTPPRTTRSE